VLSIPFQDILSLLGRLAPIFGGVLKVGGGKRDSAFGTGLFASVWTGD